MRPTILALALLLAALPAAAKPRHAHHHVARWGEDLRREQALDDAWQSVTLGAQILTYAVKSKPTIAEAWRREAAPNPASTRDSDLDAAAAVLDVDHVAGAFVAPFVAAVRP
jgi:hypothetical protein